MTLILFGNTASRIGLLLNKPPKIILGRFKKQEIDHVLSLFIRLKGYAVGWFFFFARKLEHRPPGGCFAAAERNRIG